MDDFNLLGFIYLKFQIVAECKKVASDILGEIELFTLIESTGKMTHFEI